VQRSSMRLACRTSGLGMDDSVPAGPLNVRVQVRISGEKSTRESLGQVVDWAMEHCPVTDAIRRAVQVIGEVEIRGREANSAISAEHGLAGLFPMQTTRQETRNCRAAVATTLRRICCLRTS
jgi:hypothetical protein